MAQTLAGSEGWAGSNCSSVPFGSVWRLDWKLKDLSPESQPHQGFPQLFGVAMPTNF